MAYDVCFEEDDFSNMFSSGIDDIENGDNFYDYASWFYDEYGRDIFDCTDDIDEPFRCVTGKVIC